MVSGERPSSVSITFLSGAHKGSAIVIEETSTIGRDTSNTIVIADDPKVSRRHARLYRQDDQWVIENLSQSSFITVNRKKTQRAILTNGAVVTLGDDTAFVALMSAESQVNESPTQNEPANTLSQQAVRESQWQSGRQPSRRAKKTTAPVASVTQQTSPPTIQPADDATVMASLSSMGLPSLVITSTAGGEKKTYLLDRPIINIGRDPSNDIVISDRIVSGLHLRIVRQGKSFTLIHPNPDRPKTLNGLIYQGRKIHGDETFSKVLTRGDFFRIGDEHGTLITLTYQDGSGKHPGDTPAMEPIRLGAAELTIGRTPDNTIVLNHPQVSAHHAQLTREGATYRITDLNSTNHVYVNAFAVGDHLLKMGDEIRIGPYRFTYDGSQLRQYDESSFIRIDALHLKKTGNNSVTLLDDISLSIPPRAFVALVGGSGAGKTTLMDALSGLRPAQQGKVLYNGQDYYKNLAAYSAQLGYVPQDDIVHRDLTVERALYYAAKMRLPSDFSEEQIVQRIEEVLDDVELAERRTLLVRKLSGGQRKRVSIALELLANPSVFFLDEPTSGLDPGLDRKMMLLLRNLADRGHTVVLVTHATSNINACDYICFLSAGGRMAYFGPPEEAKTYFGKNGFAEIYSSLEATEDNPAVPAEAEARFRASPEYQNYVTTPLSEGHSGASPARTGATGAPPVRGATPLSDWRRWLADARRGFSQFRLLSLRYLELLKNDQINLVILLAQAPLIALLLVLMLRFEVGAGIYNANSLVQCRTQIITAAGPFALPQAQHSELINCSQVVSFLKTSVVGQHYARQRGGVNQALQDFINPGGGIDAQKGLFIMAFASILFGCINGSREFVKEASIYRRERAVNLGILPYMFSKIVVLGLLSLAQSAVFALIVEAGEQFHQGIIFPPLLEVYVTLALTSLAGLMLGLAISAIAPNADRAISIVPIILLPQVIFSGAIIALKDGFSQVLATIFPSRWAMAALGTTVGLHAETVGGDRLFGNDYTYHSTLYSVYSQADAIHRLLLSWGALAIQIVILMVVIGVFLKRKDNQP